jgi:hypothetical protein
MMRLTSLAAFSVIVIPIVVVPQSVEPQAVLPRNGGAPAHLLILAHPAQL